MIGEVIVCLVLSPLTPLNLQDYITCQDNLEKIEYVQQHIPLIQANFPKEHWQTALLVVYCESRGKETAVNVNKNGKGIYKDSIDQGLWQWNTVTYAWLKKKLKLVSSPFNTEVATKATAWTVKHVGWQWWNSSKHCWGNR